WELEGCFFADKKFSFITLRLLPTQDLFYCIVYFIPGLLPLGAAKSQVRTTGLDTSAYPKRYIGRLRQL
ncbi:hypothetical protein, partial [Paenibacillus riograndensis]|uniref:hypothetical protein n=1 Tax=Paenibacillus riograndensis TaxID=483937 RepID=UPI001B7FA463